MRAGWRVGDPGLGSSRLCAESSRISPVIEFPANLLTIGDPSGTLTGNNL